MKLFTVILVLCVLTAASQPLPDTNPVYSNLPVGRHAVGFKIITITDASRVALPEYNYLGEKNSGDRARKITIHLWYPAERSSVSRLTSADYAQNTLRRSTQQVLTSEEMSRQVNDLRATFERFYGTAADDSWQELLTTPLLAQPDAPSAKGKFPLLIGMLRPFSTTITNEVLATNGYVVAMIRTDFTGSFSQAALSEIPDMQFSIQYLLTHENINETAIGTFGFSGSGFVQLLFAMFDLRVKALADIESAYFGIPEHMTSNYYNVNKLRIPFLHIYNRELAGRDTHFNEFYKMKFSKRYHVILNQQKWHHWNVAAEGYLSCVILNNRGDEQVNIKKSFEIASVYLLNFFDAELRGNKEAEEFLITKPNVPQLPANLWDITLLDRAKPAPSREEFEAMIQTKGINVALTVVNNTIKNDSSSNLWQDFRMNRLGYEFLGSKKYEEAIGVFKLNTELHPGDPNLKDSLAEAYEVSGDKENAKKISQQVCDILGKKETLTDAEKSLLETAQKRLAAK